jgi:hypothetical protein
LLALAALCVFGELCPAEAPRITQVRVGLPAGPAATRSRNGTWTPVYVTVQAAEAQAQNRWQLAVESADGAEVPYRALASVPALGAGEERAVLAYARPGSDNSEFTVKLLSADGTVAQTLAHIRRTSGGLSRDVLDPSDVLYLTLGAPLPGLRRALRPAANPNAKEEAEQATRGFAVLENAALLPDRWYGYEAADVVLLTTANTTFVTQLLEGDPARLEALQEWVRRGGRLVVSVGRNHQLVGRLLEKLALLDCPVKGSVTRAALANTLLWYGREAHQLQPLRKVELACLEPGPGVHTDVREEPDTGDAQARPVLVQGSCGLGRVLLAAFDLDNPALNGERKKTDDAGAWDRQAAFWKRLQAEMAPRRAAEGQAQAELADQLRDATETFGEIPVISFGWVALFLLGYIALVGPVDYFLLKKVFKRLELTWLTFPVVVLTVSVLAYVTAYYLKGEDLWTNKVDLVEIDLHGPTQVSGTTWFALFNPRGQAFTLGLEPAADGWSAPPGGGAQPAVVAVLDDVQRTVPGSPGLFHRPYDYADNGAGLRGVPVPVWATRAFTASWRAPAGAAPPVEADVRLSRDRTILCGSIVNHLPTELQGANLFWRGEWYPVGTLLPGQGFDVQTLFERGGVKKPVAEWFTDSSWAPRDPVAVTSQKSRPNVLAAQASFLAVKRLMFFGASPVTGAANSGLRPLDQSWRLAPLTSIPPPPQQQFRDEVILTARAPSVTGPAEAVTALGVSPSRLWLGELPGPGRQRPALPGNLSQETYVRVYIPVRE